MFLSHALVCFFAGAIAVAVPRPAQEILGHSKINTATLSAPLPPIEVGNTQFKKYSSVRVNAVANKPLVDPNPPAAVAAPSSIQMASSDSTKNTPVVANNISWDGKSSVKAITAILCLFVFLVLIHAWQAAVHNKIYVVLGHHHGDYLEGVDVGASSVKLT